MADPIDDARQLIQSRLAEIDAEANSLERAIAGLGEGSAPKRRLGRPRKRVTAAALKPKRGTARKRKPARAPRGQRREQLLAAIKANPGARPGELARMIGAAPAQVSNLISKARAEKLIVKRAEGYALRT